MSEPPPPLSRPIQSALAALGDGLDEIVPDVFRPRSSGHDLFGGMLLARALQAAGQTVDDRAPHALEGRFLQGGSWEHPVTIHVERQRDGRLLSSRRAEIRQDGAVLFTLDASFGRPPEGPEFHVPAPPMPPLDAAGDDEWRGFDESLGFDTREYVGAMAGEVPEVMGRARRLWVRPTEPIADDPLAHAAMAALLSDTRTGMTAMTSVGRPSGERASSLNHAMWFHHPLPPGWVQAHWSALITTHRLSLVQGAIHAPDGRRCATFVQELLLREQQPHPPPDFRPRDA